MPDAILVPLDGSPESERALEVAVPFAQALHAPVALLWAWEGLHGLERALDPEVEDEIRKREVDDRRRLLEEMAQRSCPPDVTWECHTPIGNPDEVIVETASRDARLIVMTTHGRSGFGRWRLGSVADKVLRSAPVPVVAFRPQEDLPAPERYTRILVALDGSPLSETALAEAVTLARAFEASLLLVRAVTVIAPVVPYGATGAYIHANEAAAEDAAAYLAERHKAIADVPVETLVLTGDPRSVILETAEQADLIVVASHGRGGMARFALGSVADSLVRNADIPVLVVHPTA